MFYFPVVVEAVCKAGIRGCVRISKRSGKVRFVDFSTKRLFHSLSPPRFESLFFGCPAYVARHDLIG